MSDNNNNDEAQNCYQAGYEAGDRSWNWEPEVGDNIKEVNEVVNAFICTQNGNAESFSKGYEQAYRETNPLANLSHGKK